MTRVSALALAALVATFASSARAEEAVPPHAIVKAGLGLPGLPGYAAEVFVNDRITFQLEAGTGLIGAYGAIGGRWRPCWGCEDGFGFALGLGPELDYIPYGEDNRTGIVGTVVLEPALQYRFTPGFGLATGFKFGLGYEADFKEGAFYGAELANVFSLWLGLVL